MSRSFRRRSVRIFGLNFKLSLPLHTNSFITMAYGIENPKHGEIRPEDGNALHLIAPTRTQQYLAEFALQVKADS